MKVHSTWSWRLQEGSPKGVKERGGGGGGKKKKGKKNVKEYEG